MPVGQVRRIFDLQVEITQREHISVEEARRFQTELISCREKFLVYCGEDRFNDHNIERLNYNFRRAECIQKITDRLLEKLKKIMEPVEPTSPPVSKAKDQSNANNSAATDNLNMLLRRQHFYIQMIKNLKPESELSPKSAELRLKHLSQAYEKFTSNQCEIMVAIEEDAIEDQADTFKTMQRKVISFQEKLNEMSSPMVTPASSPESKKNGQNRTEPPNYIADFLDSQCKKPKVPIKPAVLPEPEIKPDGPSTQTVNTNASTSVNFLNSKSKSKKPEPSMQTVNTNESTSVNFLNSTSKSKKPEPSMQTVNANESTSVNFLNSRSKSKKPEPSMEQNGSKNVLGVGNDVTVQDISPLFDESSIENQVEIKPCETGSTSGNEETLRNITQSQDSQESLGENQPKIESRETGSTSRNKVEVSGFPSVEEICSSNGLNNVKIKYTEADYQNITSYLSFAQHVRPIFVRENPKVSFAKIMMLVAAHWRDFSSRNPNIKLKNQEVDKDQEYSPRPTRTRTPKIRSSEESYECQEGERIEAKKNRSSRSKKKTAGKSVTNLKASPFKIKLGKRAHENSDEEEDEEGTLTKQPQVLVPMLDSNEY